MRRKKGEVSITSLAIGAAIAVIFIGIIWGMQQGASETIDIENESLTLKEGIGKELAHDDLVAGTVALWNVSDVVVLPASNYTVNYDLGTVTLTEQSYNDSLLGINYTYEPVGYIGAGITRTVLGFVAVMAAVAILVFLITRPGEK